MKFVSSLEYKGYFVKVDKLWGKGKDLAYKAKILPQTLI